MVALLLTALIIIGICFLIFTAIISFVSAIPSLFCIVLLLIGIAIIYAYFEEEEEDKTD